MTRLTRVDLFRILEVIDKFSIDAVDIKVDSSSGIGSVVTATFDKELHGETVKVTSIISDESTW